VVGTVTTDRLVRIAYHEAGHAVVAIRERIKIGKVSIRPDHEAGSLGRVTTPATRSFLDLVEVGGGRAAERADRIASPDVTRAPGTRPELSTHVAQQRGYAKTSAT
jgi:hypothetical protein